MMQAQIGQQNMNIGQQSNMNMTPSPMLPQSGLANQSTLMSSGLAGQQQINTVSLQSNVLHQSRSPSQSLNQTRTPSLSPHSAVVPNARTTSLSGQVQMVNPPIHGVGSMPSYNRTMGIVSNQGMGINFQTNNANPLPSNPGITNDGLEKYVTDDN